MDIITGELAESVPMMVEFLRTSQAQAVIWVAVAVILSVVAWYIVARFRDRAEGEDTTSQHLTKFREMERQGVLSDDEFRTIKTALGRKLQDEIKIDEERA